MARPHDSERYELSDAEKRDLIKLIEQGKPLPEKDRILLFAVERPKRRDCVAGPEGVFFRRIRRPQ